jgi:hypothetical protein
MNERLPNPIRDTVRCLCIEQIIKVHTTV